MLVTRFWYIREVDPYEKILTGMTRDGTFLVEDGKVRHGLLKFPLQRKPHSHAVECGRDEYTCARQRRGVVRHGSAGYEGAGL